jgi:predicted nucleic acid-binding protein
VRVALDTNVMAYAEGVNGEPKKTEALNLIHRLPTQSTFLSVQVLGELFHVLVRKSNRSPDSAKKAILAWQDTFEIIETSREVLVAAMDLSMDHNFRLWDAVIFAAAAAADCRLLLTEDLQDGFTWHGVTVTNPFSTSKHDLLAALLRP